MSTRVGRSRVVLVVESDRLVAGALERSLRRRGFEVVAVHGVGEAEKRQGRFDVGIFAITLGDGSGVNLAARLGGLGRVLHRVFVTANEPRAIVGRARQLGPVLSKSLGLNQIVDSVADVVAPRSPAPPGVTPRSRNR